MSRKKSGLDALGLGLPEPAEPAEKAPSVTDLSPSKKKTAKAPRNRQLPGIKQHTLYLPAHLHRRLKEVALEEDKKVHDLFMEGVDRVLKARGGRGID